MSQDLLPFITRHIGTESVNTVNARDLSAYLGITKTYANWIKVQIRRANLRDNRDYLVFAQEGKNPLGGRPAMEHHLTFDAAKHVAMMSSVEKGHQVREWFIRKEKELRTLQNDPSVLLNQYPELRAIAELAVSMAQARAIADAAKAEAQEAKAEAIQANANASRALETQAFFTVAEYVTFERLSTKIQRSEYRRLSDYLRLYCLDHGIPFRRIPVGGQRWEEEYGFHVSVWTDALPGWLQRRDGQPGLQIVHTR